MRVDVRYHTKNGATRRLAEAIAGAVGVEAATVDVPLEKRSDVLFLGASVYGGRPDPAVLRFIRRNAKDIGTIVVFGSACTGRSTYPAVRAAAADENVKTADMFFQCRGAFWFFNRGRPNEKDCAAAAEFARRQLEIIGVS